MSKALQGGQFRFSSALSLAQIFDEGTKQASKAAQNELFDQGQRDPRKVNQEINKQTTGAAETEKGIWKGERRRE